MSHIPREEIIEPGSLVHKIWRGHNQEWIFKDPSLKNFYINSLNKTISADSGDLHAICLMSNHTHEMYQIKDVEGFCSFMRKHHSRYGIFYNKKNDRSGPVSEARPKIVPIKTDAQNMICNFYIHTNPIRAGIVHSLDQLKDYSHSTYPFYAHGIYQDWMRSVVLPDWYLQLGTTADEQRRYYVYLLKEYLQTPEDKFIQAINA